MWLTGESEGEDLLYEFSSYLLERLYTPWLICGEAEPLLTWKFFRLRGLVF